MKNFIPFAVLPAQAQIAAQAQGVMEANSSKTSRIANRMLKARGGLLNIALLAYLAWFFLFLYEI